MFTNREERSCRARRDFRGEAPHRGFAVSSMRGGPAVRGEITDTAGERGLVGGRYKNIMGN